MVKVKDLKFRIILGVVTIMLAIPFFLILPHTLGMIWKKFVDDFQSNLGFSLIMIFIIFMIIIMGYIILKPIYIEKKKEYLEHRNKDSEENSNNISLNESMRIIILSLKKFISDLSDKYPVTVSIIAGILGVFLLGITLVLAFHSIF
ncbi:MAG: hypothetical protein KGV57_05030 [Fusobacterium sp.]|nr:hypothetical protein [Fusobacterium sp.]